MDGQAMTKATDETERLEKEIGGLIDAAIKADPQAPADIAALIGIDLDSLNKIRAGKSNKQYAKLARMAEILRRSPNHLLGFDNGEREVISGALEGAFEGLGHPQPEARELVAIVLKVIDTPEAGDRSQNPRERACLIAKFLIQEFVREHLAGSAGGVQ
jgi:transcriptional regulator with XRE-family HTH domain